MRSATVLIRVYFPAIGSPKINHLILVTYETTKRTLAKKNYQKVNLKTNLLVVGQLLNAQPSAYSASII